MVITYEHVIHCSETDDDDDDDDDDDETGKYILSMFKWCMCACTSVCVRVCMCVHPCNLKVCSYGYLKIPETTWISWNSITFMSIIMCVHVVDPSS